MITTEHLEDINEHLTECMETLKDDNACTDNRTVKPCYQCTEKYLCEYIETAAICVERLIAKRKGKSKREI